MAAVHGGKGDAFYFGQQKGRGAKNAEEMKISATFAALPFVISVILLPNDDLDGGLALTVVIG